MRKKIDLTEVLLKSWETSNQVSRYLIKNIPSDLWNKRIPGYSRKTVGMLAIHLHNTRCMWIKSIAKAKSDKTPERIETYLGTRKEVMIALKESNNAMLKLISQCIDHGGLLPARPSWLNFPGDVMHLLTYFVAHEANHRGQIMMAARLLDRPLPAEVSGGIWQWKKRLKEADDKKRTRNSDMINY